MAVSAGNVKDSPVKKGNYPQMRLLLAKAAVHADTEKNKERGLRRRARRKAFFNRLSRRPMDAGSVRYHYYAAVRP